MRFGFLTDELHPEPRPAIEMALEWGIRDFELRSLYDVRIPRNVDIVFDELAALQREFRINYTALSPGFFKCHLEDREQVDYALGEGLERCAAFMKACGIPTMICFGFELDTGTDDEAVARLQDLADRLADHGLRGAVENETHCKFNTPDRIAALLARINRPNLGANWDLANLQEGAADGYPAGYETVKPHIVNVHAKDWAMEDGGPVWKPIGEGVCDWAAQIRAIEADGIVEVVTIENHCGPLETVARHNLAKLRQYLNHG